MNQREPTSAPIGAGQALPCLALLLLPLLTAARAWARPALSAPSASSAKPYLVALGSPPLRFEEPAPPPDLVSRPPAAAPPQPAADPLPATPDESEPARTTDTSPPPDEPANTRSAEPVPETIPPGDDPVSDSTLPDDEPVPPRAPQPILRDDLRPHTRPEDFLPFFQIPAPGGDATVIVPTPRTPSGTPLPPSSATYIQTP
jgi:Predicted membrane protein